jgi:peptidoglycan/LPS O-acetylase OafA/YrhL
MSLQKNYISGISGLRALSIIMVLMSHWGYFHPKGVFFIINNGAFGVNVFFVISGFLITTLLITEENNSGKISLRNFYIRRTLRIFPAFYFLLLFYFILQVFNVITISVPSWITSLTYTKYFPIKNGIDNYTFHFWSLSIEEHFYLIWPFVFFYFPAYRKKILILLACAFPFLRMLFYKYNMFWPNGDFSIFYRGDGIVWGCIIAFYQHDIIEFFKRKRKLIYLPFAMLLFLLYMERLNIESSTKLHLGYFNLPLGGSFGTITSICIGLIIIITAHFKTLWSWLLNTKPLNYIGKLSYSLYLYQQIFLLHFQFTMNNQILVFTLFISMALFSYYMIELPFLKLKKRFNV